MDFSMGKLLIMGFVTILIGVVLISPIGDDVALTRVGSRRVNNETISLSTIVGTSTNESNTLVANTTTLANNLLVALTALRNETAEIVTTECNVTLPTGVLVCNDTGSATIYADYTYNAFRTGKTANDEVLSLDNCYNVTMQPILVDTHCNITLSSGDVKIEYDNVTTGNAHLNYTYEPDTYVQSATARSLLSLTILFFALAVMIVGAGMVIAGFKQGGIL